MKILLKIVLLMGMLSVAPQVWAMCESCGTSVPAPDPVGGGYTVNSGALSHYEMFVDSYGNDLYVTLHRAFPYEYTLVVYMFIDGNGKEQVQRYCEGDEAMCRAIGSGKDCDPSRSEAENLWCYSGGGASGGGGMGDVK